MSLEVVQTPFGKFQIDPEDLIGSTLKAGTLWDGPGFLQPIAKEYGRLGEPGTTILDVGANIGAFSVWLAQQGAWRVIAVEAVPETMTQLKANLDLNKDVTGSVVIPLELAAYDHSEAMEVWHTEPGNTGATGLRQSNAGHIEAEPLQHYSWLFGQRVSLIKLDIQGCEFRAILGLHQIIDRDRPVIVFEWEHELAIPHHSSFNDVMGHLCLKRYVVHEWPNQPNNYLAVPQ